MRILFCTVLCCLATLSAGAAEEPLRPETRVAVQSMGESTAIVETIATTLDHLRFELPHREFLLDYYDRSELPEAVRMSEPGLLFITDPATFSTLSADGSVQAVASMKEQHALDAAHTAGAAFIVRSDRTDLRTLSDLRGFRAEAAQNTAGESVMIGMHEILRIFGEKPFFDEVTYIPDLSEQVVHDVAAGKVDVGIVEACLLEEMEAHGNLARGVIRVVGERNSRDLACRHSTDLYPGWVLGITKEKGGLSDESKSLAADLMPALATVPKLSGIFEWTAPSSTDAFGTLLAELQHAEKEVGLADFMEKYRNWVLAAVLCFLAVFLHGIYVSRLVAKRTEELKRVMTEREKLRRVADEEREKMSTLERAGIAGQLSSMIAHELTQPLNAVVNYARGLRIRFQRGTLDADTLTETLDRISEQGMTASEIVNRVRGYAKNGETAVERCELGRLLDEAVARFKRARPDAPTPVVRKTCPAYVEGHPLELSLLIHNLLKNADEACRGVDAPVIEATVDVEGVSALLKVSDNGPEIVEETLERLFEPLHTTKTGGLGLGLSICRSIAEAHGGRIAAHKAPSGHLVFTVTLPCVGQEE